MPSRDSSTSSTSAGNAKLLNDYQLGDSLGKGAFGQVYRALNWATGETVAVKEIQLANIPKAELGEIMSEIDLLKNLNHPNIVKYKGFVKTREYLYIILEFCENGSLHAICKRFGKFPENLVAVYISQVLEGLVYLHEQGVIHRDIKGANLLTNKDGTVKLADFGVASTAAAGISDSAVVGSPYWMAPEIIEQSGATTASDIWSVGATVIELLEGRPPFHFLDPMPALFRIVQDDCPPIPDGASAVVKDFLYHCFQKDPNLRVSAKKLLKHPWMAQARRQMGKADAASAEREKEKEAKKQAGSDTERENGTPQKREKKSEEGRRPLSNYNFDDAVQQVQEWNEALKSPSKNAKPPRRPNSLVDTGPPSPSPIPGHSSGLTGQANLPASGSGGGLSASGSQPTLLASSNSAWRISMNMGMGIGGPSIAAGVPAPAVLVVPPEEQDDNWDDDFEEGISLTKIQALEKPATDDEKESKSDADDNGKTIRPMRSPTNIPLGLPQLGSSSGSGVSSSRATGTASVPTSLSRATSAPMMEPIVEDYSDLAIDEDDTILQGKVADFRMRTSVRKGLFHPKDIKTVGFGDVAPGPATAPLPIPRAAVTPSPPSTVSSPGPILSTSPSTPVAPGIRRKGSRPALSPIMSPGPLNGPASATPRSYSNPIASHGHTRAASTGGSFGRAEAEARLSEFDKYAEDEDEDYDDLFGKANGSVAGPQSQKLQLTTRLSNKSWLGDEEAGEEDPFAAIDEGFAEDDLETNLQRDKHARLCNSVNQLIDELTPAAPDFQLRVACDQLLTILEDSPEMQPQMVSSHGMLAILEVLEGRVSRDVAVKLLQIVNLLISSDVGFLESFCLIGGIPVVMGFSSKKYATECRVEASHFIKLLCHTSVLTLQMFIACRGLKVLVDLLDEDYAEQAELVEHALNGIGSVFELQSPTTKNDFCRMFIREGLLDPLSAALLNVIAAHEHSQAELQLKIIHILVVFCQVSQSDIHVRNALGTRKVVRRLLRACELLEPKYLVQMLKAIKHLSMNATLLEVLQNANAIDILTKLLDEQSSGPYSTEISNHVFQTLYNLCRLNKSRQEEAAQAGLIPSLKRVVDAKSPLKQFALPILCDLASAGKSCRKLLWAHDGLALYLRLLAEDPYFQVSALEAILAWLQDETARVEDALTKPTAVDALLRSIVDAKTNAFENLLDPILKLCRLSLPLAAALAAKPTFIRRLVEKLAGSGASTKAVVRLSVLRVLRAAADAHPNRAALVERHGLYDVVRRLSRDDGAVLVRELAREIAPALKPGLKPSASGHSRKASGHNVVPSPRPRSPPPAMPNTSTNLSQSSLGLGISPPRAGLAPRLGRRTVSDNISSSPPGRSSPLASGILPRARVRHTKSRTHLGDSSLSSSQSSERGSRE